MKSPAASRFGVSEVELVSRASIPRRHRLCAKNRDEHQQWASVRDTLTNDIGTGFLMALIGKRGTGKTQLAADLIAISARTGRSGLYVSAMEIFLQIRATYAREGECELDAIERFTRPAMLVIDEIQQRGESDFENRILAYIIDKRYGDMSDTIVIGNLTPQGLEASLDPSIVDRLRETGGIVQCVWQSFRRKTPESQKASEDVQNHGDTAGQGNGSLLRCSPVRRSHAKHGAIGTCERRRNKADREKPGMYRIR